LEYKEERRLAFQAWAPDGVVWSQWAKPVLFSREPHFNRKQPNHNQIETPQLDWEPQPSGEAAVIIDLPAAAGVLEGLALARAGFRPVPLYNGVYGPNRLSMAVDVTDIVDALFRGAEQLESLPLRDDAPPAFLLDAARMQGTPRQQGKFDNRWCVFPQDMPSASFLLGRGIRQIYLRTDRRQNDLSHILLRYQQAGIKIFLARPSGELTELEVVKPSRFRSVLYRLQTMLGLTRNAAGGFGAMIPEPAQSTAYAGGHFRLG
jgi:hypothetical protein